MNRIDASTRLVALLGSPVAHSFSPRLQNAAFAAAGLNIRYVAFDVPPDSLSTAITGLRALGFLGANVTIPHKREIARYVDVLSPVARATGAVNTLVFRADSSGRIRVEGDNSDVGGFLHALEVHRPSLSGKPVLVLGAGGAARAVVHGLARQHSPSAITIAARTREAALQFMKQFEKRGITIDAVPFELASDAASRSALIVNATPIGMHPQTEVSPIDSRAIGSGQTVYDLVYNPAETLLLRNARACGATTIDGVEMLLAQAAESFRSWTGAEMPLTSARAALEEAIHADT
jgi:shikimate dehydrogenase